MADERNIDRDIASSRTARPNPREDMVRDAYASARTAYVRAQDARGSKANRDAEYKRFMTVANRADNLRKALYPEENTGRTKSRTAKRSSKRQ